MLYRRLDSNGDYVFGRGPQNFLTDIAAVTQAISTRLKLLLGEWWEDTSDGLPLYQSILGQSGQRENLETADLLIRERILGTDGVSDIAEYSSSLVNRSFTVSCTVNTVYGIAALEVSL